MSHVDEGALHAYLDGELSPAERAELEAHLAGCAACRTRLSDERALVQRAGELLGRALPPESEVPPLGQLERRRRRWRLGIPLSWAASVILAVALGYNMRGSEAPLGRERAQESANTAFYSGDSVLPLVTQPRAAERARARESNRQLLPPQLADSTVGQLAGRAQERESVTPDQVAPAAGVIAIREEAPLRAVPPRPAPQPAPAAPSAAAEVDGALRSRVALQRGYVQLTTEWRIIPRASARQLLGADPVGVPGLAVRQMRSSPSNDGTVLVEQAIDSSTVIQLYQRRLTLAREDRAAQGTTERLARFVGDLRIEIAGPLSQDSLNRLLDQLRPLP